MAILGNIIKGFIQLKDTLSSEIEHTKAQEKVLEQLLEKAKNTQFGAFYKFQEILNSKDFLTVFHSLFRIEKTTVSLKQPVLSIL